MTIKRWMAGLTLLLIPCSTAFAATFRVEEELSIVLPIRDDLYAAGGSVVIKEPVGGDLILGGGEVTLKARVDQDVIIAGGDITIDSTVGDDVRIIGGSVQINGSIGDDLIVIGGDVEITGDSVIKGDLNVYGGNILIDGTVRGNLRAGGGRVVLLGTVGGDIDIRSDELSMGGQALGDAILAAKVLEVSPDASFIGDVRYWQPEGSYDFGETSIRGEAIYDESIALEAFDEVKQTALGAFKIALFGIAGFNLLSSALVILLMILLTRTYFSAAAKRLHKKPWLSLLYGFLYIMLTPMIVLLFIISFIGIPIGLFIFIMYIFTLFFAKAFTAPVLAKWLEQKYKKKWGFWPFFLSSIGIYIAMKFIALIPIIGWLVVWLSILFAFGAMMHTEWEKYKKVR